MAEPEDPKKIRDYHAHVYYDDDSRANAARMREQIEQRFKVEMGRWRDEPVGPHPVPMFQVKFSTEEFSRIVPWMMLNREGLNILVHPNTDDSYRDHMESALWLGDKLKLRTGILRRLSRS